MAMAQESSTDVLHLKLSTTHFVVLSSPEVVSDLTIKRSNLYSDRPPMPMLELLGHHSWNIGVMEYGTQWRNGRRVLHEFLNSRAVTRFDEYQYKHAHRLLLRLAECPGDLAQHIEFAIAALIMEMTYGMNITTREDRSLRSLKEGMEISKRAIVPGAFLVDTFPILKHVPEWFPGAGFKTFARVARDQLDLSVGVPLEYTKESMKLDGNCNVSIARSCFNRGQESISRGFDEGLIRAVTATMYAAAVETTVAMLRTFFLAMALNPHVVKKAQEELGRVVGDERLPDFSDQGDLPYISAIMKELLRWACPVPLGVPKRAMGDDTYRGYSIPAGATVVENIWAMFYDESTYPMPYTYDPERYLKDGQLDPSVKDPEERVFGSGRRICSGKHFAMRTLFINITCILSLLDIEAPIDEKLEARFFEKSALREPLPFKCTITPRSEASMRLIRSLCAASDH